LRISFKWNWWTWFAIRKTWWTKNFNITRNHDYIVTTKISNQSRSWWINNEWWLNNEMWISCMNWDWNNWIVEHLIKSTSRGIVIDSRAEQ
jgi:hypothetical protein